MRPSGRDAHAADDALCDKYNITAETESSLLIRWEDALLWKQ